MTRAAALGWVLLPSLALAQVMLQTDLDSGAFAGRVCSDLDGDGQCSDAEPGLAGVRVMTETGLSAVTDLSGAYHLASLPARSPDRLGGEERLLPGRHRLKVDERTVVEGAQVSPRGVTLELPSGGLQLQHFAVRVPAAAAQQLARAVDAPPRAELTGGALRVQVTGRVAEGDRVRVGAQSVPVDSSGLYRAWVSAGDGQAIVALRVQSGQARFSYALQRIDVVRREGSVLIVPRAVESVAVLTVQAGGAAQALVMIDAQAGTRVEVGAHREVVGASGHGVLTLETDAVELPLTLTTPDGRSLRESIPVVEASGVSVAGLLDVEAGLQLGPGGGFRLAGRGAASVKGRLWGFDLGAQVDLRDSDLLQLSQQPGSLAPLLATGRRGDVFERQLDPLRVSPQWADDATVEDANPGEQRLRVEISRRGVGRLGYGQYRAWQAEGELGRFHRAITGAYLEAQTPADRLLRAGVTGFYAAPMVDPLSGLARLPVHDRLEATGGSLYYLSNRFLAQGSELVRVEVGERLSGVPVSERQLIRGVDYSIDYAEGRVLLARPLSMFEGLDALGAEPLSSTRTPVLVVDYERYDVGSSAARVAGGEARVALGPVSLAAGGAEDGDAQVLHARAQASVAGIGLSAEVARSAGLFSGHAFSDDGGLDFVRVADDVAALLPKEAWALAFRARGPMIGHQGAFDVSFRRRTAGFSDAQHLDTTLFQQLSARVDQPIGPVVVGAFYDDRVGPDARAPETLASVGQRLIGGGISYDHSSFGLRLEARDTQVTADGLTGGRTSVGLSGHLRVTPWLTLVAGHKQRLGERGAGLGAFDDSFSSVGADLRPTDDVTFGVRGGWGPALGPQVWGQVAVRQGSDVWYGGHSLDVDGPSVGEQRWVSGVRREVGPGAQVFVEDVVAHDPAALRLGRAVGLSQALAPGLAVTARYEHGLKSFAEVAPTSQRDVGSVGLSLQRDSFRGWARGEVRSDQAVGVATRVQAVATAGGEATLRPGLRATVAATLAHTTQAQALVARLLEGTAAIAWRYEWLMMVLKYSLKRELSPPSRGGFVEQTRHVVSWLPAARLGDRFSVGAGVYLGLTDVAGQGGLVASASLRPAVRIVAGLEAAGEVVRRSSAPDGEGRTALRLEAGYRFDERFFLGAGYSLLGFSGNGVDPATNTSRLYLRAEAAY